jgi:hypothetical protein
MRESSDGYVDDSTMTSKSKTELAEDSEARASDVQIEQDAAEPSGLFNSESDKREATLLKVNSPESKPCTTNLIVKITVATPTLQRYEQARESAPAGLPCDSILKGGPLSSQFDKFGQ